MARKELTPEEEQERQELYERLYQEALDEPLDYLQHDTDAFEDDALRDLFDEGGYDAIGKFWHLAELLARKKGHAYSVVKGYGRLAYDMHMRVDEMESFIQDLYARNLIIRESFDGFKSIRSARVMRNAERAAETKAKARLGAEITHAKRREKVA